MKPQVVALVDQAREYLLQLPSSDGAIVMLREGRNGAYVARKMRGIQERELRSHLKGVAIAEAGQKGESAVVFDTTKDPRFEKKTPYRSSVCVPVPDSRGVPIGLLYTFSKAKPGAFSYAQTSKIEEYAKELGRKLDQVNWEEGLSSASPPREKSKPTPSEKAPRANPLAGLELDPKKLALLVVPLLVVALLGVGYYFYKKMPPDKPVPAGVLAEVEETKQKQEEDPELTGTIRILGRLIGPGNEALSLPENGAVVWFGKDKRVVPEVSSGWGGAFTLTCPAIEGAKEVDISFTAPGYSPKRFRVSIYKGRAEAGNVYLRPAPDLTQKATGS